MAGGKKKKKTEGRGSGGGSGKVWGGRVGGLPLPMPEHSAARLNRVNCSGGQGVQHSSGTLCLQRREGEAAGGWGGARGGRHTGKEIISQRPSFNSVCVCVGEAFSAS